MLSVQRYGALSGGTWSSSSLHTRTCEMGGTSGFPEDGRLGVKSYASEAPPRKPQCSHVIGQFS
jgi:hypothetical protein